MLRNLLVLALDKSSDLSDVQATDICHESFLFLRAHGTEVVSGPFSKISPQLRSFGHACAAFPGPLIFGTEAHLAQGRYSAA